MYTYKIVKIGYQALCLAGFCAILFLTVFFSVLVALWDHDISCIISGACFGLVFAIIGSLLIFLTLFIFNLFIPVTKGISIQLTAIDIPSDAPAELSDVQNN